MWSWKSALHPGLLVLGLGPVLVQVVLLVLVMRRLKAPCPFGAGLTEERLSSLSVLGGVHSHRADLGFSPSPLVSSPFRVFACLPKLEVLDGIPRLPEDSVSSRLRFPECTRICSIL